MIIAPETSTIAAEPQVPIALAPIPKAASSAPPEASAKGGARGLSLLSSDIAAVVIDQQAVPAAETKSGLDLRGKDLRDVDLSKLDLRGADLSGADLTGKDLTGLDFSGATLVNAKADGANFTDARLDRVDAAAAGFAGALFARTSMNDANFSNAKFTDAWFGGTAESPDLTEQEARDQGKYMIVRSSDFSGADFSRITAKYNLIFDSSNLDDVRFDGAKARGWVGAAAGSGIGINYSTARNASFQGASADVIANDSDLSNSDFSKTTSKVIDIRGSNLDNASFADSAARFKFGNVDLRTTDLSVKNRDLRNSIFANANIAGKDLSGYDFSGSYFQATGTRAEQIFAPDKSMALDNLVTGTNFTRATFNGATFSDFDMRKALTDAGAFAGARQYVNETDKRYHSLGDIFRNVSGSLDAARILYALPLPKTP